MKNKSISFQYLCLIALMLSMLSCKKNELSNKSIELNKVKVYNDTLANAENGSVRITSGKDRLYMTYGIGQVMSWFGGTGVMVYQKPNSLLPIIPVMRFGNTHFQTT